MSGRRSAVLLAAALSCAAPVLAVCVAPGVARAQPARDPSAEAFVGQEAQQALNILNGGGSISAKKSEFRQFVNQAADVGRITRFVLGRYARFVTPAQYAAFSAAFRDYADSVYETRLGQYRGESLRVTGSKVHTPTDVVVGTEVVGGASGRHDAVSWRVQKGADGNWRVVDVNVAGVWLAITEQQDFVSTLNNNRGDIDVLINQLRTRAAAPPAA